MKKFLSKVFEVYVYAVLVFVIAALLFDLYIIFKYGVV